MGFQLNLSDDETNILTEILQAEIGDLSMEIADTDQKDYRDKLKLKKNILQAILNKMVNTEAE